MGAANPNPWYTFVTDMDLLNRCAFRLGLSRTQTIERICKELLPPNWETLFWMHACLENLGKNAKELVLLERRIHEADKFAISGAAKRAAQGRHAKNHCDKKSVFKWCDEHMHKFKSMDDAALNIAETFIPQKFRTVRE